MREAGGEGVSPDTHPIRAAIQVANKPLAISVLVGAGCWVAGGRSGGFAAQPASEFVTPIQAAEKRLAVGERPYGTQQYLENMGFFKTLGKRRLNIRVSR